MGNYDFDTDRSKEEILNKFGLIVYGFNYLRIQLTPKSQNNNSESVTSRICYWKQNNMAYSNLNIIKIV